MISKREGSGAQRPGPTTGAASRTIEHEIIHALGAVSGSVKAELERIVRPHGLTLPFAMALMEMDESISMKELGHRLRYDSSFLTAIADGLEERGLARREVDPDDRRSKRLVLTRKGSTLKARLHHAFFVDVPWMSRLDEQERQTFLELLRKMADGAQEGQLC